MSGPPVIVHSSLNQSDLVARLTQKQLKVRFSNSTPEGSLIFPQCGPVFLVLQLPLTVAVWPPAPDVLLVPEVLQRIEKAATVHPGLYILTLSALLGVNELNVISALQNRLATHNLNIIPLRDGKQCVECMCNLAKVMESTTKKTIVQRYNTSSKELCDNLLHSSASALSISHNAQECITSGLQSVSQLIQGTAEQFHELGVSVEESHFLEESLSHDQVTVQ